MAAILQPAVFHEGVADHADFTLGDADGSVGTICGALVSPELDELLILLSNVRGLRQGAGELRQRAHEFKPHLVVLDEFHLGKADLLNRLFPPGFKCVSRSDRTRHGGGII